jgi:sigma-54-specific transcriptional regulator
MSVLTLPAGTPSLTVRARALVFEDPRSKAILSRIEQIAPSEATVLVTGETGTGKEIVARQIHQLSRRAAGPFLAVNCGAFSENLVESELFGHERGAFTGALQAKAGWFEAARGGTLFLDEIGDLPLLLQVKLLRVLQENEVVRLGSREAIPIDVRLIAATNVDLLEAMAAGHFREDLYYRLNVVSLTLPPLRERPGDIPALARYFIDVYRRRLGLEAIELTPAALEQLLLHTWPGNLRELENAVHHALLVCRNGQIRTEDIRVSPPQAAPRSRPPSVPPPASTRSQPKSAEEAFQELTRALAATFELGLPRLYERIEETLIRTAYEYSEKNQLQTARLLDISRNIVRARLIQHGELRAGGRSAPPDEPHHAARLSGSG